MGVLRTFSASWLYETGTEQRKGGFTPVLALVPNSPLAPPPFLAQADRADPAEK